ncbi:MAG: hypothetical protein KIT09_18750 [Bryobacteraceae bacterium]|nr:hypothetical protein [Bryobacteraceae bacterium]
MKLHLSTSIAGGRSLGRPQRVRVVCYAAVFLAFTAGAAPGGATEEDALRLSRSIRERHMPFGTILDPIYDGSGALIGYTRCGDSAIWTGHYLAAESFRYSVTRWEDALDNVRAALAGIKSLVDVTGGDRLARCLVPAGSPFAAGILSEEAPHRHYAGTLNGAPYEWVGNTSRDQYSGVFFGLGVAYDFVDDPGVRATVHDLVARLLGRLLNDNWAVVMPDGSWSTVFWGRSDQQLSFMQVGRRVAPERFEALFGVYRFWYASSVVNPIAYESLDPHNSYFKFNLAAINLFNLIRLERNSYYNWWYQRAYRAWRNATGSHLNAHFNMIDRALGEPNGGRDLETRILLEQWLYRPARDEWVDLRGRYAACLQEDRSCTPIPAHERVNTDFLWQRSPFLLYGGGSGRIESPGIDYILPYWMARYYGVL